ncbi:MAG: hypothetical protein ACOC5T_07550 [Elusimicrobiota bacterium]
MDIDKILKEKKEELQKKVDQYNSVQNKLNDLKTEIIKLQGSIEQLQELKGD